MEGGAVVFFRRYLMARHPRPRKSPKPPKPRTRHPRQHHPRPPDVHATTRDTAGDTFDRTRAAIPIAGAHPALAGSSALELTAGASGMTAPGLFDVILELVGAEHVTLRQTLTLWQREQDRTLNRTWRRPGGLARPAGL